MALNHYASPYYASSYYANNLESGTIVNRYYESNHYSSRHYATNHYGRLRQKIHEGGYALHKINQDEEDLPIIIQAIQMMISR